MSDIINETRQCPYCGTINDAANDTCKKCGRPLMTFDGQAVAPENFERKLAGQIAAVETRPQSVLFVTMFTVFVALFWPLRAVITGFSTRPAVNSEGTNAIGAAFGTVGPMLSALFFVPLAIALFGLAWATWTQRTWAWLASAIMLGLFLLTNITKLGSVFVLAAWIVAGGLLFLWFRPATRAWFGQD